MDFMLCRHHLDNHEQLFSVLTELGVGLELQGYGFRGVESQGAWYEALEGHRALVPKFGGELAVHGPFLALSYHYIDHLLKEAVQKRIDMTIELAEKLGVRTVVLHTNYKDAFEKFGIIDLWLDETSAFWQREIERFAAVGARVVLENVIEADPTLSNEVVDRVDHESFGLCLDVGHANVWSKLAPAQWVERMGKRLFHIHLHDNLGDKDAHLPVGQGNIDFDSTFAAIGQYAPEATVSVEVKGGDDLVIDNLNLVLDQYGP